MKILKGNKPVYRTGAAASPSINHNLTAQSLLARPTGDVLILDTETTGFNGEVIELAIINLKGDTLYCGRFCPKLRVEAAASAVHGITDDMLRNEPTFTDEYHAIKAILEAAKTHLIYNAAFDVSRLDYTCAVYNVPPLPLRPLCLMKMRGKRRKLGGSHNALGDCLKSLEVLKEIAR